MLNLNLLVTILEMVDLKLTSLSLSALEEINFHLHYSNSKQHFRLIGTTFGVSSLNKEYSTISK
jgi:hypothetical protein